MDKRPIAVREMGDELVILDTRSNQIHQLNRTAAFVWKEARNGANPEAISMGLFAEFDVEKETAVADSMRVLGDLSRLGLLDFEAQSA